MPQIVPRKMAARFANSAVKRDPRRLVSVHQIDPDAVTGGLTSHHYLRDGIDADEYRAWLVQFGSFGARDRGNALSIINSFVNTPLISVVMPVYNADVAWLREAIESVRNQVYPHWQLCIADDCSTVAEVRDLLREYQVLDPRIKVVYREQNGHISEATNSAIDLADGAWMALLDQDDLLSEDALYRVARVINDRPETLLIYSDEDKIDETGARFDPYFKPDWNPELFHSQNYVCHLGVYRLDRVREINCYRKGYEGSQDYDLALRFADGLTAAEIHHEPRVLYHWRSHSGSTAQSGGNKGYAANAGQKALEDHLARHDLEGSVEILNTGMYRVHYALPEKLPLVSIIIPTKNSEGLVRQCLESILDKTTYPNYEILLIDNNSDDDDALAYFEKVALNPKVQIIRDGTKPFNYSAINNNAVRRAKGDYIALLNNDIEVITPGWLDELMSYASQPGVGCVGARLWYPNNMLQHGGVVLGIGGVAGHIHKHLTPNMHGYFSRATLAQTMSAVTAACLVVKKSIYLEVGGLDDVNLKVAFNDVDFCIKVREAGYRNIWTPYAELYHHESASRGLEDTPEKRDRFRGEVEFMIKKWGDLLTMDPAYNPNLSLNHEHIALAWPPRRT
jgi:glycosyltransferase involved in cell wall biosynthesis